MCGAYDPHHRPPNHDSLRLAGSNPLRTRVPRRGSVAHGSRSYYRPASQDGSPKRLIIMIKEVSASGGVVGEYPVMLDGQTTTSHPITVVAWVMAIAMARRRGLATG